MPPSPETEDIPDDWIDLLKDRRHAIGKEGGFWHLSRKGYAANKKKLKAAFLASPYKRGTWEEFEAYVAKHFSEVEAADERFERGLATKLTFIRAIRNRT